MPKADKKTGQNWKKTRTRGKSSFAIGPVFKTMLLVVFFFFFLGACLPLACAIFILFYLKCPYIIFFNKKCVTFLFYLMRDIIVNLYQFHFPYSQFSSQPNK